MAEYIERDEAVKKAIDSCIKVVGHGITQFDAVDIAEAIESIPTADVVEVRHGEWNIRSEIHQMFDDVDEELFVECPFCQRRYHVPFEFEDEKILEYAREQYPYCHCGAKMDGKEKDRGNE